MKGLFIGLTTIDILYPLFHYPSENSKNNSPFHLLDIGGPATNAAFTFSALGGEATLISLVGNTSFSPFINEKLEAYNILHIDIDPESPEPPITSSIILNQHTASRTIVTSKPKTNLSEYKSGVDVDLTSFDIICIDGSFSELVLDLLRKTNQLKTVVYDGGSFKKNTIELMPYITFPIFSERFESPDLSISELMKNFGIDKYAITKGEKPIECYDQQTKFETAVPKVKAIDTLGAGDVFHGAFSYFILSNNFRDALSRSAAVASESCRFVGCREWVKFR